MMMKSEQVAGYTGAATVLQHARVVLPVCALGVKSVGSLTAVAKLALTSPGMPELESLQCSPFRVGSLVVALVEPIPTEEAFKDILFHVGLFKLPVPEFSIHGAH